MKIFTHTKRPLDSIAIVSAAEFYAEFNGGHHAAHFYWIDLRGRELPISMVERVMINKVNPSLTERIGGLFWQKQLRHSAEVAALFPLRAVIYRRAVRKWEKFAIGWKS